MIQPQKKRRLGFDEAMKDVLNGAPLVHMFIDSVWNTTKPRTHAFCSAYAWEAVSHFLLELQTFPPLKLEKILYTKTETMKGLDSKLIALAEGLTGGYLDAIKRLMAANHKLSSEYRETSAKLQSTLLSLSVVEKELEQKKYQDRNRSCKKNSKQRMEVVLRMGIDSNSRLFFHNH